MNLNWRTSITSRTLLLLASAVGFIIVIATAITYQMVFTAVEARDAVHLHQYTTERAGRLENYCTEIQRNLETVRDAYVERYRQADPPGYLALWDEYFERSSKGSWVSKCEYSNDYEYAPLWGHKNIVPSDDFKRRILIMFETCQKFLPGWVRGFRSLYGFTNDDMAVIGFDPALAGWIYAQEPDYDINKEQFGILGTREGNPSRSLAFTWITADVSSGHSLVSVVLPIEVGGRHVISVGHDMWVDSLISETTRAQVPGLSHMIFRQDGKIIANPDRAAEIYAGNGLLTMENSGDPASASLYKAVANRKESVFSGFDDGSDSYYAVQRIAGAGWLYLTKMPRSVLRHQAYESTRWVLWSALTSLALELLLVGIILRRSIEQPVAKLVAAARSIAAGETDAEVPLDRPDELGTLARAFDEMARKVRERDEALRAEKTSLEQHVTERTDELAQANRRLAESLRAEKELGELRANFVSLVSHEFRTPLEVILTSSDILYRYLDRLTPEKRSDYLLTIHEFVKRMGGMMEDVLLLGRVEEGKLIFNPQPIDLHAFCHRITDEMQSATTQRCPVHLEFEGDVGGAFADESLLRHIFGNLLSNAAKYSHAGAQVNVKVRRAENDAIVCISDQGRGIPSADRQRLFQSFQRGSNVSDTPGTGLGLLIVKKCTDIHGGTIAFDSEEGRGTRFTVTLPLFTHKPPLSHENHSCH